MSISIIATVESEARDCDGMHYRSVEYRMEENERTDSFGDLDFFNRVLTYVVSTCAEEATLKVRQDENRMPVFEWSESTEEGFRSAICTFTKE